MDSQAHSRVLVEEGRKAALAIDTTSDRADQPEVLLSSTVLVGVNDLAGMSSEFRARVIQSRPAMTTVIIAATTHVARIPPIRGGSSHTSSGDRKAAPQSLVEVTTAAERRLS